MTHTKYLDELVHEEDILELAAAAVTRAATLCLARDITMAGSAYHAKLMHSFKLIISCIRIFEEDK